jgi:hypothetical protein
MNLRARSRYEELRHHLLCRYFLPPIANLIEEYCVWRIPIVLDNFQTEPCKENPLDDSLYCNFTWNQYQGEISVVQDELLVNLIGGDQRWSYSLKTEWNMVLKTMWCSIYDGLVYLIFQFNDHESISYNLWRLDMTLGLKPHVHWVSNIDALPKHDINMAVSRQSPDILYTWLNRSLVLTFGFKSWDIGNPNSPRFGKCLGHHRGLSLNFEADDENSIDFSIKDDQKTLCLVKSSGLSGSPSQHLLMHRNIASFFKAKRSWFPKYK